MEISQEAKEGETGVSQLERVMTETDVPPVQSEDEPQTPYQLGWRTILAVLTLSMANVCAALSNTVCWPIISHLLDTENNS
jgi:hypothetical protein